MFKFESRFGEGSLVIVETPEPMDGIVTGVSFIQGKVLYDIEVEINVEDIIDDEEIKGKAKLIFEGVPSDYVFEKPITII